MLRTVIDRKIILIYFAVIIIIVSYFSYAAKPGGLNYVPPDRIPGHTGSQMQMLYLLGAAGVIVLVAWLFMKK